jgi:hypothetical protein
MDKPKLGKNKVHIGINASVGTSISLEERKIQANSAAEELSEIGATKQNVWVDEGEYRVVMLEPEGNQLA